MTLNNLFSRLRLFADELMDTVRAASDERADDSNAMMPVSLENRVLLSATPLPVAELATLESETSPPAPEPEAGLDGAEALSGTVAEDAPNSDSDISADSQQVRRELVFIDTAVEDYGQLLDDIWSYNDPQRQLDVVLLSGSRDGVVQISNELKSRSDLDAIHLVSHGTRGAVKLGSTWLNATSLGGYAAAISGWGDALSSQADFLIYGCDLGGGDGALILESLAALTNADVAASDDLTGHKALGGDWELERAVGVVETEIAFSGQLQMSWQQVLASVAVTTTTDENDGDTSSISNLIASSGGTGISLREAVIAANNTAGDDTIILGGGDYIFSLTGDEDFAAAGGSGCSQQHHHQWCGDDCHYDRCCRSGSCISRCDGNASAERPGGHRRMRDKHRRWGRYSY